MESANETPKNDVSQENMTNKKDELNPDVNNIWIIMEEAKGNIRLVATAEDPTLQRCFRGHEKTINTVAFSKDMYQSNNYFKETSSLRSCRWNCTSMEF